jgi:kynurenine formamidase
VPTFVDLSAPIEPSPSELPDLLRTDIEYSGHAEGAQTIEAMLGVPRDLLRDGEGWAVETFLRFGTHNSTHVDAPWHYNSTIGGQRAQTIDELPLEWFHAPGVVLDFSTREDGDAIDTSDVEAELARIGHTLAPLDIVLVRTGRDAFYAELDYIARGPGVTAAATRWLYEHGVRVMGIDAWAGTGRCTSRRRRPRSAARPASSGPPIRPICPTRRSSASSTSARCRAPASG